MRGTSRKRRGGDEGMTLVEVLVASVIMFIVLTAILGLVGTSTRMSAVAKQQNVVTNAVSDYTERIYALPFEDVGLASDGVGVLEPKTVHVPNEANPQFTIVFTPTVTAGANPYLKNVTIDVTITRIDGQTQSMTTSIIVRDRSTFLSQAVRNPETDPKVMFLPAAPPDGTVVWDNAWMQGETVKLLTLAVNAEASEGRIIEYASLWVDGHGAQQGGASTSRPCLTLGGGRAERIHDERVLNWTDFVWHTTVPYEDGTLLPDGWRVVTFQVDDSMTIKMSTVRRFLIDNHPPNVPGAPVVKSQTPSSTTLSWVEATDGTDYAHGYELRVYRWNGLTGTWQLHFEDRGPQTSRVVPTDYFSRYYAEVRSYSPRFDMGYSSFVSEWVAGNPFGWRPMVTGTYRVETRSTGNPKYWRVTSTMSVTAPTFPTEGQVTYSFHRVVNGVLETTPRQSGSSNTFTHEVYVSDSSMPNFPVTYYLCLVTYTPAGGGASEVVQSNTVVTTAVKDSGTYTFAEGTW